MAKTKTPEKITEFPLAVVQQMIVLATSGFGLVVALAWNELIKQVVEQYIRPYFGEGSGIISLFIYALAVTVLAVFVTMQLTQIQKRLEKDEEEQNAQAKKK